MNSIDTNILYYATNSSCSEHPAARSILERIADAPFEWIIADQVLFEFYRLVRNPVVLERPLTAEQAARRLRFFREELGCLHCGYDVSLWPEVYDRLVEPGLPASKTFDVILAVTLARNGVDTFYTRNVRDFREWGLFEVVDPIAEESK